MKNGGTIDGRESESAKGSGENGGWEERVLNLHYAWNNTLWPCTATIGYWGTFCLF